MLNIGCKGLLPQSVLVALAAQCTFQHYKEINQWWEGLEDVLLYPAICRGLSLCTVVIPDHTTYQNKPGLPIPQSSWPQLQDPFLCHTALPSLALQLSIACSTWIRAWSGSPAMATQDSLTTHKSV